MARSRGGQLAACSVANMHVAASSTWLADRDWGLPSPVTSRSALTLD